LIINERACLLKRKRTPIAPSRFNNDNLLTMCGDLYGVVKIIVKNFFLCNHSKTIETFSFEKPTKRIKNVMAVKFQIL